MRRQLGIALHRGRGERGQYRKSGVSVGISHILHLSDLTSYFFMTDRTELAPEAVPYPSFPRRDSSIDSLELVSTAFLFQGPATRKAKMLKHRKVEWPLPRAERLLLQAVYEAKRFKAGHLRKTIAQRKEPQHIGRRDLV